MADYKHVEVSESGDSTVVRLRASNLSDREALADLSQEVKFFLDERRPQNLVLDLSTVEFLTSAGLSIFIALNKRMRSHQGSLTLRGVQSSVHEVLVATNLDKLIRVEKPQERPTDGGK